MRLALLALIFVFPCSLQAQSDDLLRSGRLTPEQMARFPQVPVTELEPAQVQALCAQIETYRPPVHQNALRAAQAGASADFAAASRMSVEIAGARYDGLNCLVTLTAHGFVPSGAYVENIPLTCAVAAFTTSEFGWVVSDITPETCGP